MIQKPQGEYRRNRLQLKKAAIPTTVPVSKSFASTTISTTVQSASFPLYAKDVLTKSLCPIKELLDNNEDNSSVSAECVPDLQNVKWWKKLKLRNLGGDPGHTSVIMGLTLVIIGNI